MIGSRSLGGLFLVVGACIAAAQARFYFDSGYWFPVTLAELAGLQGGSARMVPFVSAALAWIAALDLAPAMMVIGAVLFALSPWFDYLQRRRLAKLLAEYQARAREMAEQGFTNPPPPRDS